MAVRVDPGTTDESRAFSGKGGTTFVPPLLRSGLCAVALEHHGGAEAETHLSGDRGASRPLLQGSPRAGAGVLDRVSEGVDRWHSYRGVSFGGIYVAQYWAEFVLWESLLNEKSYDAIVELGTWEGGFSLYLHAQAQIRGMDFRTYDIKTPPREVPGFMRLDIYALSEQVGEHLSRSEPVIVFCDGGNKPRELKTFSRYVTEESTLVVHDWGEEMFKKDVPENVEMIHREWCEELGSASRVFRVRDA